MDQQLCLMCVHAHPDDESSKGAGTVARYHAEGVRCVLVCATGGEEGDILNPAMDRPEVRARLEEVRQAELARATEIIGYDEVVMLGYRDSGMPGSPANQDPRSFAAAPLEEATARLVAAIRRARPQVLVTYGEDQRGYPHPDHIRVHEVSVAAFEAAGDASAFPEAGPPWQPLKLYYTVWSLRRIRALHEKFLELGLESPFGDEWFSRPFDESSITTRVDVSGFARVRA
ncbi:MAG TPA: PIG-L family deacetylase [Acidimicrobiales bacterium]|nr:PIG-L family deacetylase [Acidimicrobiales bacterium]